MSLINFIQLFQDKINKYLNPWDAIKIAKVSKGMWNNSLNNPRFIEQIGWGIPLPIHPNDNKYNHVSMLTSSINVKEIIIPDDFMNNLFLESELKQSQLKKNTDNIQYMSPSFSQLELDHDFELSELDNNCYLVGFCYNTLIENYIPELSQVESTKINDLSNSERIVSKYRKEASINGIYIQKEPFGLINVSDLKSNKYNSSHYQLRNKLIEKDSDILNEFVIILSKKILQSHLGKKAKKKLIYINNFNKKKRFIKVKKYLFSLM